MVLKTVQTEHAHTFMSRLCMYSLSSVSNVIETVSLQSQRARGILVAAAAGLDRLQCLDPDLHLEPPHSRGAGFVERIRFLLDPRPEVRLRLNVLDRVHPLFGPCVHRGNRRGLSKDSRNWNWLEERAQTA